MRRLLPMLVLAGVAGAAGADASTAASPAPALPDKPADWQAAAARDIAAAYAVTLANHAGALDPHNPAFPANLKAARDHGLALAAQRLTAAAIGVPPAQNCEVTIAAVADARLAMASVRSDRRRSSSRSRLRGGEGIAPEHSEARAAD